jgi:hypothetical protein
MMAGCPPRPPSGAGAGLPGRPPMAGRPSSPCSLKSRRVPTLRGEEERPFGAAGSGPQARLGRTGWKVEAFRDRSTQLRRTPAGSDSRCESPAPTLLHLTYNPLSLLSSFPLLPSPPLPTRIGRPTPPHPRSWGMGRAAGALKRRPDRCTLAARRPAPRAPQESGIARGPEGTVERARNGAGRRPFRGTHPGFAALSHRKSAASPESPEAVPR